MRSKSKNLVGLRLIFWGWGLLIFLCLGSLSLANLMSGSYGSGEILIRPWMQTYNNVLLLFHLLVILSVLLGAILVDGFSQTVKGSVMRFGAIVCFGLSATCFIAMSLFPHLAEPGPWKHDATEVAWMRVLVFLPLVTRATGLVLLIMAIVPPTTRSKGSAQRGWYRVLVGFATLDVGLSVWKWAITPKAVIAVFHPFVTQPMYLVPWCVTGILVLVIIRSCSVPAATSF
ncbi:MAG: hypothetical protein GY762_09320 [Proteobacteria bacterium]|nr:hypothetical protein [Pseudomonadota bacterium]